VWVGGWGGAGGGRGGEEEREIVATHGEDLSLHVLLLDHSSILNTS
jgi:hypothetical protein